MDNFEFKEPKAEIKNKIENFFNMELLIEKYLRYALYNFVLVPWIILLLF